MPIYEYECQDCKHVWDVAERIADHVEPHAVRCPKCASEHVEQVVTQFFAKTSKKS